MVERRPPAKTDTQLMLNVHGARNLYTYAFQRNKIMYFIMYGYEYGWVIIIIIIIVIVIYFLYYRTFTGAVDNNVRC